MKLHSIELENFRQFYGLQTLRFAEDKDNNVTLVFGANGAGKTTLLNAFTWCFYNQFSPAFEDPRRLINERAWAEASLGDDLSARVTVEFEHEGLEYTFSRVTTKMKSNRAGGEMLTDSQASCRIRDQSGRTVERQNPETLIDQILPERLHRFFFFDGERIEHLVKPTAYKDLEEAIKNILGLEILERANRHIPAATKTLESELASVAAPQVAVLKVDLDAERQQAERLEVRVAELKSNRAAVDEHLEKVNERLRSLAIVGELQKSRDETENELRENARQFVVLRKQLSRAITKFGFLAFSDPIIRKTIEVVEANRAKGMIPAAIQLQLVDDLLEKGICICGTRLGPDSPERRLVEEWRARAGEADVQTNWSEVAAHAKIYVNDREALYADLQGTRQLIGKQQEAKIRLEERLDELHRKIGNQDSGEIQELERRRESLRQQLEDIGRQVWIAESDLKQSQERIEEKQRELATAEVKDNRGRLTQRRIATLAEARQAFEEIFKVRKNAVRLQIDERIKRIYSSISYKAYEPQLNPDFRLELTKTVGLETDSVAKGTGENQILSLSFVGALAKLARERYQDRDSGVASGSLFAFQGGVYPLVMDSPFGALDENYRQQIATAVPELAPQLIVFVSKSQGLGPVVTTMGPRAGKAYVIDYFTSKPEAQVESIDLFGRTCPYIERSGTAYEWAKLEEVR